MDALCLEGDVQLVPAITLAPCWAQAANGQGRQQAFLAPVTRLKERDMTAALLERQYELALRCCFGCPELLWPAH